MSNTGGMDDVGFALRFRRYLESKIIDLLEELRPLPRYGRVDSFNRFTGKVNVILNGDTVATPCFMAPSTQPSSSNENNIANDPQGGDVVRVEGRPGSRWVTEIIAGREFQVSPRIFQPILYGGGFLHIPTALFDTYTAGLPAVGSTWHAGRWDNAISFASDATGWIDVEVQWTFFTSQVKHYHVPIKNNVTSSSWRKLAPDTDSGPDGDNDFQLEIMVDGSGYELRIRRTKQGAGFTPGGFDVRQWIFLDNVAKVAGSEQGEAVTTEPTLFFGVDDTKRQKGPFESPFYAKPRQAQASLSGGGRVSWDGSTLGWNQVFRAAALGKGYHAKSGYYEIGQPGTGIGIPCYSNNGLTTVTTTASGFPLINDQALYYEPPWGDTFGGLGFNFRIVDTVDDDFVVPSHWILVAQRCSVTGSPSLKLGTGEEIDHWRAVSFTNGWADNAGGHETCAYRLLDGRVVKMKGLAKQSAATPNTSIFTLPAEYRPSATHIFVVLGGVVGSTAGQRVDISSAGTVLPSGMPASANSILSLANIAFYLS